MNPIQNLIAMGLSWTTLIELAILLLFYLIFCFWFFFLIFLGFLAYIGLKVYQFFQLQKLSTRTTIFNQDIPKEMRAAYYSNSWKRTIDFGDYLVPSNLKGDEVLIKVHSASLNPSDFKFNFSRLPFYRWYKFPNLGIGKDFSGEIVKTGTLITKFRTGDLVYGFSTMGTLQEYTIAKEKWIHIIPDRIKFEEAAGLPLVGVTVYQALTYFFKNSEDNIYNEFEQETDLSGKNILVIGATGGCGHVAVQLAKFLNANEVYGVCSSAKVELIKNLQVCEEVFAYDSINFQKSMEDVLISEGEPKLDLILDTVSSPEAGDVGIQYTKFLKPEGKYVSLNSKSYLTFFLGLLVSFIPKLNFEKKGTHCHMLNRNDQKGLDVISKMASQGKMHFFTQLFGFNFQDIDNAIKLLKSRTVTGKLICNVINDEEFQG